MQIFSGELLDAVKDWLRYKQERRQSYKPTGRKTLIKQIQAKADEFGQSCVVDLIRESMSANYSGIIWDKLDRSKGFNQQNKSGEKVVVHQDLDDPLPY